MQDIPVPEPGIELEPTRTSLSSLSVAATPATSRSAPAGYVVGKNRQVSAP